MKMNFNMPQINFASMGRVGQYAKQQNISDSLTKQFDSKTIAENLERSRRADSATLVHDTSWQKIVPVSDEVKKELTELVKSDFTERGGMSGENSRYTAIVNGYLNKLPKSERPAALYTLFETFTNEARRVRDFIKSKDPSWDFGQSVRPDILEEAFKAPAKLDVKI